MLLPIPSFFNKGVAETSCLLDVEDFGSGFEDRRDDEDGELDDDCLRVGIRSAYSDEVSVTTK